MTPFTQVNNDTSVSDVILTDNQVLMVCTSVSDVTLTDTSSVSGVTLTDTSRVSGVVSY